MRCGGGREERVLVFLLEMISMLQRSGFCGFVAALWIPLAVSGQEKPLNVNGTFSTGYYNTTTRGEANQSANFVPVGARFEVEGYYATPELLSFSAQPELNYGPQASDAGFEGGNGIRLGFTFLGKSITPLTFRYSNLQDEDVYFGSLSQVSGYTLKERNKDLGLTWEFKPHGLPATTIDWGRGSVDSQSSIAGVTDYQSFGDRLNVESKYERAGWDLQGFMRRTHQNSNLLALTTDGTSTGTLREAVIQYQGTARRSFLGDSELLIDGGSQSTSSLLFDLPVDLSAHYVSANFRLMQKRRWKTLLRLAYSSNLASQLLAQAAGALAAAGSTVPGNVLAPFSHGMANLNLDGVSTVDLGHGLGFYGSIERNATYAYDEDSLNSNYFTVSAGMTYARKFRWGNLSGEYAREFGAGSLIGQSGTIQGQRYSLSAQHGGSAGFQFDGTVRGSQEDAKTAQPLANSSFATEGSIGRRVAGSFSARLGGGWQWGDIVNAANDFRTNGYTARASVEHPLLQLSASLNNSLSNSLPIYDQLAAGLGLGSALLTPQSIIPSDFRAMSYTLHANPLRKLEIAGSWTRSAQHLDGLLSNTFELLNVYARYHFRRIQLESGFTLSNQVFSLYPNTLRKRVYIRIVRNARIL
jgi:hypothetical protein